MSKPITMISALGTASRDSVPVKPIGGMIYNFETNRFEFTQDNGATWLQLADLNDVAGKLSNALASGKIFIGNASNIAVEQTISGDISLSQSGVSTLASTLGLAGTVGSSSVVPVLSYDVKGRLTNVGSAAITPAAIGAPTNSGVGANGTWNIGILGQAASALTVTNGVYTVGSQSIDGFKSFLSKLFVKAAGDSAGISGTLASFQYPVGGSLATDVYAIQIVGTSDNTLKIGVNKNSTTGTIPAFGSFIATEYLGSTLTFLQGGVSGGSPGNPWMHLNSDSTVTIDSSANSTSTTTGALRTPGGIGVVQDVFVGQSISVGTRINYSNTIQNVGSTYQETKRIITSSAVTLGDALKMGTSPFRVTRRLASDPINEGIVGFAAESAAANSTIKVYGMMLMPVILNNSALTGDFLEASQIVDGRVISTTVNSSAGTFGVAMEQGNAGATIMAAIILNNSY